MGRFGRNGDGLETGGQRSGPSATGTAEFVGADLFSNNLRIVTDCKGASQDLIRAGWPMAWAPKCLVISACMCQALSRDMATPRSSSMSVQP